MDGKAASGKEEISYALRTYEVALQRFIALFNTIMSNSLNKRAGGALTGAPSIIDDDIVIRIDNSILNIDEATKKTNVEGAKSLRRSLKAMGITFKFYLSNPSMMSDPTFMHRYVDRILYTEKKS